MVGLCEDDKNHVDTDITNIEGSIMQKKRIGFSIGAR